MKSVALAILLLLTPHLCGAKIVLPDSMYSVRTAYAYNLTNPDTALAIIETLRERQVIPDWRAEMIEGDFQYGNRRYMNAVPFYERALVNEAVGDSILVQLELLNRLVYCYDVLNDYDALATTIVRLHEKSNETNLKAYDAKADFMTGKRSHLHGDKAEGYDLCLKALEQMKQSDYFRKYKELRDFYADLLMMYARDGRYDEALRMSELQEEATRHPSGSLMPGIDGRDLRRVYALRASVLAGAGRMAEADEAYALWQQTGQPNAVDDHEIMDYLVLGRHYDEALSVIEAYRDFVGEQGDTISYRMLSICNQAAILSMVKGDYEMAADYGRKVGEIADSIHLQVSHKEMANTYVLLQHQKEQYRRNLFIMASVLIIFALFVATLIILYYTRAIRHRNRVLVKAFNGLDAYRKAVLSGEPLSSPEVIAALEDVRIYSTEAGLTSEELEEPDDEDRRLFVEMDKQVTRDKLFLKPGLGREDLMRLIGVDKNRFGKMMVKYSDASNTSVYINSKRVEFGAQLLLEHPEYTIATIATECGMSNTVTFNRTFKDVYGLTPSEYREKMKSLFNAENGQNSEI